MSNVNKMSSLKRQEEKGLVVNLAAENAKTLSGHEKRLLIYRLLPVLQTSLTLSHETAVNLKLMKLSGCEAFTASTRVCVINGIQGIKHRNVSMQTHPPTAQNNSLCYLLEPLFI